MGEGSLTIGKKGESCKKWYDFCLYCKYIISLSVILCVYEVINASISIFIFEDNNSHDIDWFGKCGRQSQIMSLFDSLFSKKMHLVLVDLMENSCFFSFSFLKLYYLIFFNEKVKFKFLFRLKNTLEP